MGRAYLFVDGENHFIRSQAALKRIFGRKDAASLLPKADLLVPGIDHLPASIDGKRCAVLLLRRSPFFAESTETRPSRIRGWLVAWLMMVVGSMALLAAHRPERLAASTPLLHDEGLVILQPSEWIGKPFPLQPYLHPENELSTGRWVVVLYHHDCPKCQEALPKYERLANESGQSGVDGILAVEVPPFGTRQSIGGTALKRDRLSEAREWFVQAPVEIQMENGVVTSASMELPSVVQAENEHGSSEALK